MSQMLIDAKFPGILQKIIDAIDKRTNRSLTRLKDKLAKYENFWQVVKTILRIFSLELIYIDIFKDTSVTVSLLALVGGPTAIIYFPTKFTSVIIIIFSVLIILPLIVSSFHLAIYNSSILFNWNEEKSPPARTIILKIGIILMSALNPILIVNCFEESREEYRKLVKNDWQNDHFVF